MLLREKTQSRFAEADTRLSFECWQVKTLKRAAEKLYRSYHCDISRLLDCCRYSNVHACYKGLKTF